MNLEKFPKIIKFEDAGYGCIFMATAGDSDVFYATKAHGYENEKKIDLLICLGPFPHKERNVSAPCIYFPSVLRGKPVLDMNEQLQIVPSQKSSDMEALNWPQPGSLIYVEGSTFMALEKMGLAQGQPYLNLDTGTVTFGMEAPFGYVIKRWTLQTVETFSPQVLVSCASGKTQ